MIPPRPIGPFSPIPHTSPQARRYDGKAVIPGQDELRTVELFDARPTRNVRQEVITPHNASFQFLRFARWALDPGVGDYREQSVVLAADEEALFYINSGHARLRVGNDAYDLVKGDVLYVGLGKEVHLAAPHGLVDLSEFRAADCHTSFPVQLVRHADIEGTALAADVGTKRPMSRRTVYKLVDQNVSACRLLFGDTYLAHVGGVGSYPPHFHGPDGPFGMGAKAKEEIYHFRCESTIPDDTPYVLQNCARPGEPVNTYVHLFDDQAINVTPNYHDTIAPPAVDFMFVWCLGAFTEHERDWSAIFSRPGYENEW